MSMDRRWEEIVSRPEESIDLAEAALAIAAEEYRGLDIPDYLARIDEMGATLRQRLRRDITTTETIIALNHYLFDELGFSGNATDYYDPRNSYLNEVLDRRLGIPITLSIVYVEVGRRAGLGLRGVSLGMDDLRQRIRAVQGGGAAQASDDELRRMLVAAGKKDILARVLRNLKAIYLQKREMERALSASMRLIALDPRTAEEYRDRGAIYHELECFRAALVDYERYLQLRPRADDAQAVKERLAELQQLAARLN